MKNFQVRLGDEIYEAIKQIAKNRSMTIASIIREGLEIYSNCQLYTQDGWLLMLEEPKTGKKIQLLIPSRK